MRATSPIRTPYNGLYSFQQSQNRFEQPPNITDWHPSQSVVEWKRNLVAHGDAREEKWRGKRRMEWVIKQASVWLGTVHPVLLQSFSPTRTPRKPVLDWTDNPGRYKWTRPFRWKTESGFCACAITFRLHSTYMNICFLLQEATLRPRIGFTLPISRTIYTHN